MKYLRSLKEELSPDTYRRAGEKLIKIGKEKRGSELLKKYKELSSVFNFIKFRYYYDIDENKTKIISDTDLPNLEFKYGFDDFYDSADDLINAWLSSGETLGFTIVCKFNEFDFYLNFLLNDNTEGIGNHDIYDYYYDKDLDNPLIFLNNNILESTRKSRRTFKEYASFSDRKSAIKFKKFLIEELVDKRKFNNEIRDILEIIGTDVEELDKINESIKNIRINMIYQDSEDEFNYHLKNEPINI
jgi:hypothetical protein